MVDSREPGRHPGGTVLPDSPGDPSAAVRLDDPDTLRQADRTGLLMHASMAGGQLRSVGGALDTGALDHLRGARPRSLVWISGRSDRARQAGAVVAALAAATGHPAVPPIVFARSCPTWVGTLDLVLVSGDDAGDPALAEAVGSAVRRGSDIVFDVPEEGPVRSAARDEGVWLESLPYVPAHRGVLRHVGAGLAVLTALGVPGLDPRDAAEAVDVELASLSPELATAVNPAKLLAVSAAGPDRVQWIHADEIAGAVAARAVSAFAAAGRNTASLTLADALQAAGDQTATAGADADPYAGLFHDPEIDGERPEAPLRYLGIVCAAVDEVVAAAAAPLGRVEWITQQAAAGAPDDDNPFPPAPEPGNREHEPGSRPDEPAQSRTGRVVALMARLELAAAYLLVGGL